MSANRTQRFYPYAQPCLNEDDIAAAIGVLRGTMITTGPNVASFERAMCQRLGTEHAVAVSSGTAALHLAAIALGLRPGDEVLLPTLTFLATANAVCYTGATPVLIDIDAETRNLDLNQLESALSRSNKIKAILPVHFGGLPCPMPELRKLAEAHGCKLVEDAAHALGGRYSSEGQSIEVGSCRHSDAVCLSFHAVKNITTGEGGMIVTNDARLAADARKRRHHGMQIDFDDPEEPWVRPMNVLGYNYRLTDFQCAMGESQLTRLDQFVASRRRIAALYDEAFRCDDRLIVRPEGGGYESSYHLYVIELEQGLTERRLSLFRALRHAQIGAAVHYPPVHLHPYYRERFGHARGDFPVAEAYYQRSVSLPMYPDLADEDVAEIVSRVTQTLDAIA